MVSLKKESIQYRKYKNDLDLYLKSIKNIELFKEYCEYCAKYYEDSYFSMISRLNSDYDIPLLETKHFNKISVYNPFSYAEHLLKLLYGFDVENNYPRLNVAIFLAYAIADKINIKEENLSFIYPNLFNRETNPFFDFIDVTIHQIQTCNNKAYILMEDAIYILGTLVIDLKKDPKRCMPEFFDKKFWDRLNTNEIDLVGKDLVIIADRNNINY